MSTDPGMANQSASISLAVIGCRVGSVMPAGPMTSGSGGLAAARGKNSLGSQERRHGFSRGNQSEKVVALAHGALIRQLP